ncbi:heat shock 70kDa protein 8 [Trichonephila clavipes]|uniref:Heat shock 70kDa protein 8 n=1 Tax=Trichonephila clavipes TaxID=2585209 RepID=A0A8X6UXE8_TRICX|nr:heat shock 70kDa protein 8 [Trichonephila clavipes]
MGREDVPQSTKRSIEAERLPGELTNAGRPKAVIYHPRTQSKRRSAVQLNHVVKSVKRVLFVELWGAERISPLRRRELWFQQDGATCHTARATIDLLKDTFGDRLISRFGPVNWPPRSCDLTPLDYFLWGYVKSLVYADKPQTLDHLEDNIRRVIADIRPQMLEKVIENWTSRLDYIRASRGSHMPEIIFKM